MKTEIPVSVLAIIHAACEKCGVRLLEANVRGTLPKRVRLEAVIDSADGITHEDCRNVSKLLDEAAETNDFLAELFAIDILSPGTDRPLTEPWQFPKHKGRTLATTLKTGEKIEGVLENISETDITLQPKRAAKQKCTQTARKIQFSEIDSAVVQVLFRAAGGQKNVRTPNKNAAEK
ncbi:hypothetical protein MASR2M18_02450 [Ignavibacteria bacterium]|nr:hypothetical protein [Bacteroidota bacterium]MCZ2133085.1 hypothetical protein [Bacteroidota bacterium]